LSALSEVVDKVKGFEVGGVDYITKPVQKEELLARISAHLKIRHQQRSLMRFFSIVSHDLRSPFNSLITVTKYVSENIDSFGKDELKEMMLSLYENTSRTLKFAENLLSWARLQNQSLRAKPRRVDPGEIARDVLGLLRGEAGRKNIDLSSDMSETAVWADHDMLHLVLRNLASNAIKFTPRGGSVTMASQRDGETVAISVTDTGVGIAPESLRDMFNVHRKTQSLGTDQERGTGLGLLLSKEMVDRNNGTLTVESVPNAGSTFTVRLPATRSQEEEE
jgi:signal transduction histidine kinase